MPPLCHRNIQRQSVANLKIKHFSKWEATSIYLRSVRITVPDFCLLPDVGPWQIAPAGWRAAHCPLWLQCESECGWHGWLEQDEAFATAPGGSMGVGLEAHLSSVPSETLKMQCFKLPQSHCSSSRFVFPEVLGRCLRSTCRLSVRVSRHLHWRREFPPSSNV